MFTNLTFQFDEEDDDEYQIEQITNKLEFDDEVNNEYLSNLYDHSKIYGYPLYKLYEHNKGKFHYYGILKNDFRSVFADIKSKITTVNCRYDDDNIECVTIDRDFFDKLYRSTNTGLKTCIAQLVIFRDNQDIINKCIKRVETYIVPKVAIELMDLCIINPQYDITGQKADAMFVIKSYVDTIPGICLEIDEDGHKDRDPDEELNREQLFRTFGHRIIRESVKRNATLDELNEHINNIVEKIRLKMKDMMTEYSLTISESDFINKMEKITSIDIDFLKLFAKKDHNDHGSFKYTHNEIADFLGYESTENENNRCKGFIELMKKELKLNIDYIVDDKNPEINFRVSNSSKGGRSKKTTYFLTRIGFYILCMMASKPKAKVYRRQFGEVYELALQYTQSSKNSLINSIQPSKISERAVTNRLNYKADSLVKNKSVTKLQHQYDGLLKENEDIKIELNKYKLESELNKQTINDLTNKINDKDLQIFNLRNINFNYLKLVKSLSDYQIKYVNKLANIIKKI
jgi:hypothetical protein